MDKEFYRNCIIEDRNSRQFLDFSEEQWFKDFLKLQNEEGFKDTPFEHELYRKFNRFMDIDVEEDHLGMLWNNSFPTLNGYLIGNSFSLSKEILDLFCTIKIDALKGFLNSYKPYEFGNIEESNKSEFKRVNIPLIHLMDYFLEKRAFKQLAFTMRKLEYRYLIIWFELTIDRINKIIEENIDDPNLLYVYSQLESKEFSEFFIPEYICIMNNAPFEVFSMLMKNKHLPEELIYHKNFFNAFKSFDLKEQIHIIELMDQCEYSCDIIKELHSKLNKFTDIKLAKEFFMNVYEMSEDKFISLRKVIENSSYFKKNNIQQTYTWQVVKEGNFGKVNKDFDYYSYMVDLYNKCREYATSSIVQSLYPLNQLTKKVTHMNVKTYNILARVRTMWEANSLEETFQKRTFCSFSILTEKNMSHYGKEVLYGYYTNITSDLIAHIFSQDSLSIASAIFESKLTKKMNMLLDIDDLNQLTLEYKTYNQLCIRTKTKDGDILLPDCIICIEEVDDKSQKIADELGLNILVLHKSNDTIENNYDVFAHLQ